MLNALIVVWRESLEAMLVIGILLAWIVRQPDPVPLRRGLWLGLLAGLGLAVALGFATFAAQSQLQGEALETFHVGMVLFAAILIVQMVIWMRRHGRQMKRQLEDQAARSSGVFGIGAVTALAVAREGAETVMFLYGLGLGTGGIALLGLAAGIDRMIGLDCLPPLLDPVWDASALLDDRQGAGRLLADFLGYRARPSATLLIAYAAFWTLALGGIAYVSRGSGGAPRGMRPQ